MNVLSHMKRMTAFVIILVLGGCVRAPEGVEPVTNFDVNRYLGTWYEIARLDHSFERGLTQITAEYSLEESGAIKVINRGYNPAKEEWNEAQGRAYFVDSHQVGSLKVSFFGPFYGGYNIIELDHENYSYALVCGPSLKYLWILSRTPVLNKTTVQKLVDRAKSLGFDTDNLIYVAHEQDAEQEPELR